MIRELSDFEKTGGTYTEVDGILLDLCQYIVHKKSNIFYAA